MGRWQLAVQQQQFLDRKNIACFRELMKIKIFVFKNFLEAVHLKFKTSQELKHFQATFNFVFAF